MKKSDWVWAGLMYALFVLNLDAMAVLAQAHRSEALISLLAAGWAGTVLFKIDARRETLRAFRR